MNPLVFISRDLEDTATLVQMLEEHHFDVIAQSQIKTEMVRLPDVIPDTDWIFFSSVNAVKYFFTQSPIIHKQAFGCIGEKTALELSKYHTPSFVGQSIDPITTAKEFAVVAAQKKVLFAGAEDSLRSIQSALPPENVSDVVCYRTTANPVLIQSADVLVFSSPSNVRAFFQCNESKPHQRYVAFGPSTQKTLEENGVRNSIVPESLSDTGIFNAIKQSVMS